MEIQQDFNDLLTLFNEKKVEYIIVGAYALAFHGAPRYTGDIDLLINRTPDNASNILACLEEFGFGNLGLTKDDFTQSENVIQLGMPPVRIDILTSISGVSWGEVEAEKVEGTFGELDVYYIGKSSYVENKKATGRLKDLADIEAIEGDEA